MSTNTVNIEAAHQTLNSIVDTYISKPRRDKLLDLYDKFSDELYLAPASSNKNYHNCFPGGYIDHIIRVVKCSLKLLDTWKELNANIKFTTEELVFSALNHDLGKLGDLDIYETSATITPYYIVNDNEYTSKKGQLYTHNPELSFMKVPDRSLYTLQKFGIALTENETLAIKLHDGLYSKGNESYLMAMSPDFSLRTNLPLILHHADHLASLIESRK